MASKNMFILVVILSLILQCISQDGLNCGTMKDGLCNDCKSGFEKYPTVDNFRTCRRTIDKCSLWTSDLQQCIECSTATGVVYSLFVPALICGIDNCAVADGTTPTTKCS